MTRAAMVGGAGLAIGNRHGGRQSQAMPPASTQAAAADPVLGAASEANRIDALVKLKSLLDSGVLTQVQYGSEHARLIKGI